MRAIKYIAILFASMAGFLACEEEFSPNLPKGRTEEIFFAKDTFVFNEAAGMVKVPISATKYLNYSSLIKVKVTNGEAVEKEHFFLDEKEVKMELGTDQADLELRIVNDTIINPHRTFTITLESIQGGGVPAATKQSCVVVIRNDDFIPEAAVVFDNLSADIREDGGTLTLPFHITKPVEGDVTVTFGQGSDDRQTAKEGTHFTFVNNVKNVTLPEGTLKGEIKLDIINNNAPDGNVYFDLAIRQAVGVLIGQDSICKVNIEEDDLDRTVRFGQPENDTIWHEEAGVLEIPLIFENGVAPERMISGKIIVDSIYGCTNGDFKLETTEFSTAGNETLKVRMTVKDNATFGDWGVRLAFRELKGARAVMKNHVVKIKDDERILGFKSTTYTVNEGDNVNIIPYLYGGIAATNVPLQVEVVADQTTALAQQYTIPTSLNAIYARTSSSSFTLRTFKHSSREDKVLALKITTTAGTASPGKILTDTTQICKITIKSTDAFVRFAKKAVTNIYLGTYDIPLETSGYNEDVVIYVGVKSSTMNAADYKLVSNFVTIPAGQKSGNIQLKVTKPLKSDDQIVLEMTRVVLTNSGGGNEEMDPDNITCVCKYPAIGDVVTDRVDRTGWSVLSFSTEEATGEGATGRAKDILDGNLDTYWHSKWQGGQTASPHTIVVDLNSYVVASGADVIRRKGRADTKNVLVELSQDQTTWSAVGTISTWTGDNGSVRNTTNAVDGRFMRLTINKDAQNVAAFSEIYLTGKKYNLNN